MPSIKSILTDIQTLPLNQVEELLSYLEEFIVLGSQVGQVCEEVKEFRFSKGKVCPHCTSESISRNGKYNGKQRYICKDCRKTFTDFTNSALNFKINFTAFAKTHNIINSFDRQIYSIFSIFIRCISQLCITVCSHILVSITIGSLLILF